MKRIWTIAGALSLVAAAIAVALPRASSDACPDPGDQEQAFESSDQTLPTGGLYWQDGRVGAAGETRHVQVWWHNYDAAGQCMSGAAVYVKEVGDVSCPSEGRDGPVAEGPVYFLAPTGHETRADGRTYVVGSMSKVGVWRVNDQVGGKCAALVGLDAEVVGTWEQCISCCDAAPGVVGGDGAWPA